MTKFYSLFLVLFFCISFVSAIQGIGIKYNQESAMVNEGDETCLTYSAYNPWDEDVNVIIDVSDSLKEVLVMQEAETKFLPAYTSSQDAIPIKFCFKVPKVYSRDCSAGPFLCELKCDGPMKEYLGDVSLRTVPLGSGIVGAGGSSAMAVVGAPLRIRIACNPYPRNYTILYVLLALISITIIAIVIIVRSRRPKVERDREKLRKLKEQIRKETSRKKKK